MLSEAVARAARERSEQERELRSSGDAGISQGRRTMLSEAVARAARERSEQERELRPSAAAGSDPA